MPDFTANSVNELVLKSLGPPQPGVPVIPGQGVPDLTFKNWDQQPWRIQSTQGVLIATLSGISLTLVESSQGGGLVITVNLNVTKLTGGWATHFDYVSKGPALSALILDSNGGLLQKLVMWPHFIVNCDDNGVESPSDPQTINATWFAQAAHAMLILDPSLYNHC